MKNVKYKLETCKGNFVGTYRECVAWLNEYQPSFASVVRYGKPAAAIDWESYQEEEEQFGDQWANSLRDAIRELYPLMRK